MILGSVPRVDSDGKRVEQTMTAPAHVVIVGGGATGAGAAHDLALRGLRVTPLKRGELTDLGQLPAGHHRAAAQRRALRRRRPGVGDRVHQGEPDTALDRARFVRRERRLFVALTDDAAWYYCSLTPAPPAASRPPCTRPRPRSGWSPASTRTPGGRPQVPDAVDPMRLVCGSSPPPSATAPTCGTFTEVTGLAYAGRTVDAVPARDLVTLTGPSADLVVNAAGPWSGQIGAMAEVTVPMQLSPGSCSRSGDGSAAGC